MKKLKYKKSYVSISGDYYELGFDDDPAEPDDPTNVDKVIESLGPYFMVQYSFEFGSKKCYIESDDEDLIGDYIINSVVIDHGSFTIKYGPNDKYEITIYYEATDEEQTELISASKKMFDNVEVLS